MGLPDVDRGLRLRGLALVPAGSGPGRVRLACAMAERPKHASPFLSVALAGGKGAAVSLKAALYTIDLPPPPAAPSASLGHALETPGEVRTAEPPAPRQETQDISTLMSEMMRMMADIKRTVESRLDAIEGRLALLEQA